MTSAVVNSSTVIPILLERDFVAGRPAGDRGRMVWPSRPLTSTTTLRARKQEVDAGHRPLVSRKIDLTAPVAASPAASKQPEEASLEVRLAAGVEQQFAQQSCDACPASSAKLSEPSCAESGSAVRRRRIALSIACLELATPLRAAAAKSMIARAAVRRAHTPVTDDVAFVPPVDVCMGHPVRDRSSGRGHEELGPSRLDGTSTPSQTERARPEQRSATCPASRRPPSPASRRSAAVAACRKCVGRDLNPPVLVLPALPPGMALMPGPASYMPLAVDQRGVPRTSAVRSTSQFVLHATLSRGDR